MALGRYLSNGLVSSPRKRQRQDDIWGRGAHQGGDDLIYQGLQERAFAPHSSSLPVSAYVFGVRS